MADHDKQYEAAADAVVVPSDDQYYGEYDGGEAYPQGGETYPQGGEAYPEGDNGAYDLAGYPEGEWAEGSSDPYAGYVYDEATGEYVYADAAAVEGSYFALDAEEPVTSPFEDEAYWQQYGDDGVAAEAPVEEQVTPVEVETPMRPIEALATLTTPGDNATTPATSGDTVRGNTATPPPTASSLSASHKKKKNPKTKQERMEQRQAQLEQAEAEKTATTTRAAPRPPPTLLERERAVVRLRLRQVRALRRKRMPLQVRILTAQRARVSPLETYFGGSIEPALADVFWAARKGDLRRVRFLIEIEHASATDCALDPWHMEQTPLHWAAKGGSAAVVEYLLAAGANPRSLDENGSLPLHLACWGGHVDATLALLRATDTKDLYVRDYDAALAPLDWAQLRGHTALVKAIERYEHEMWLPKFVDDLIRGIIRYKIKLYKEPPKSPKSPTRGIQFRRAAAPTGDATNNQKTDDPAKEKTPVPDAAAT